MQLKAKCEDFLVEEILKEDIIQQEPTRFSLFMLEKRNYTTERAVAHLAQALRIPRKRISYAGTKDKQAITTQLICIEGEKKEKIESLQLKDIQLQFVGYAQERLGLGDLQGNTFTIVVRDIEEMPATFAKNFYVPNYFDEQRFSNANLDIGVCLLKKDFAQGAQTIMKTDKDFAQKMQEHLIKQENDYLGAMRLLPKKTLLFFVHAVQSFIFNELLGKQIQQEGEHKAIPYSQGKLIFPVPAYEKTREDKLPLVGFDTECNETANKILDDLGITQRDFLIKQLPELTLEGSERDAFVPVHDFEAGELQDDELNPDKKKITISFQLPKGAYATIVVKQLLATP